jgi:maltose O-acetyltransferase
LYSKFSIRDEVKFGPKSIIVSSNHTIKNGSFRFGGDSLSPVRIGFGSWIGGNCAILAGSVIGKGTVIGANSVTSTIVPDNCLFAGNPGEINRIYEN